MVYNEILLCRTCHALVHAGLLKIEGDLVSGLRWITACDQIKVDLREELKGLASIPAINLSFSSGGADGSASSGDADSAISSGYADGRISSGSADGSGYPSWLYDGVLKAMLKIGYSRENARKRLEKAWKARSKRSDPSSAPTEEEVLLEAIRASPS